MHEILTGYGLPALFIVSFLASTILPLGSEWLLVTLLLQGSDPYTTVSIATLGNSLGATTNYIIGYYASHWLSEKILPKDHKRQQQAQYWFNRYGSWSLLFSWLPVLGDPLCIVSGMMKTPPIRFIVLVTTGKALRYSISAILVLQGAEIISKF